MFHRERMDNRRLANTFSRHHIPRAHLGRQMKVPDGDEKDTRDILHSLRPVLYTQNDQVFWYHSSFPDFIFDRARSNLRIGEETFDFWCNEPALHIQVPASPTFDFSDFIAATKSISRF